ncbi:hypothetical protein ACS5UA_13660 [Brucella sp. RRSP16]|uniref:Uncharacterized protein n=1 Tax=Brucella intermedia TaxID=94625 RepID=A0A7V6PDD5_9HYPH|nr:MULTISPECIES: hypothetical protein [Brucella/Ochrobactrum group]HHV68927.1 hypothetical protein [Brucella intermedia]
MPLPLRLKLCCYCCLGLVIQVGVHVREYLLSDHLGVVHVSSQHSGKVKALEAKNSLPRGVSEDDGAAHQYRPSRSSSPVMWRKLSDVHLNDAAKYR